MILRNQDPAGLFMSVIDSIANDRINIFILSVYLVQPYAGTAILLRITQYR